MHQVTRRTFAWLVALLLAACAAAQTPIEEGYVPVGDAVELYYRRYGAGAPELIVTNQTMAAVPLSPLADGRTVVIYDTRGRGLSSVIDDPSLLGMEHEIADIGAVQDHFGGEPAVVLGWSLWGGLAQLYAARNPGKVRGVIAFGAIELAAEPYAGMPMLKSGPDFEALEAYWSSLPEGTSGYERCPGAYAIINPSQVSDASMDLLPELNLRTCALWNEWDGHVMDAVGPLFASMGAWDWRDEAAGLQVPLLIVHGDQDTVIPEAIEANAGLVRDAEVVVVENAGHMGFVEHPDRYVEILASYLAALP